MKIRKIKTKEIIPNDWNPNILDEQLFTTLVKHIKKDGFLKQPILIRPKGKRFQIIDGYHRWKAANVNSLEKIDCVVIDVSEHEAKKISLAMNKIRGVNEDIQLNVLLKELLSKEKLEDLIEDIGFDEEEINFVLDKFEPEVIEDEYIPTDIIPISKKGQIYSLGNHRLMCGDATNKEDVEKLMDGNKADMVLTDPPYGMDYKYNSYEDIKGHEYLQFCEKWFNLLKEFSKLLIITTGWKYKPYWYSKNPYDEFIWVMKGKHSGGKASNFRICEPIFIFGKVKKKYDFDWFETTNVLQFVGETNLRDLHTCPKPISLITDLIIPQTKKSEIILDIFGGSGTTLIACEQLNRKCFMMEIDEHYCDVIIARWEKFTGKKAELI